VLRSKRFVDRFRGRLHPGRSSSFALAVALLTPSFARDSTATQAIYKALVLLVIACPVRW